MQTRRSVLRAGGAAIFAGMTTPTFAAISTAQQRALAFDNLHTNEKLAVTYWQNGGYVRDALTDINHVLRDYKNNEVHVIDPKLLDLLNLLHRQLGSSVAFEVISGYRSPATNAAMHERSAGVAAHSLHMQGMAIDIRLADTKLATLHEAALDMRAGGVGFYPTLDFVHVDVGRVRRWNG